MMYLNIIKMFWATNWLVFALEYCYVMELEIEAIEENDYGQFIELD